MKTKKELKKEIERRENLPKKSKEAFETTIFYNDLKLKELKAELKGYKQAKKEFIEMIDKLLEKYRRESYYRNNKKQFSIIKDLEELKSLIIGSEEKK